MTSFDFTKQVLLNFVEIRDSKETEGISQNSVHSTGETSEEGEVKLDGNLGGPFTVDNENGTASETGLSNEMGLSMSSEKEIESVKKVGFFSWKRRRLRFSPTLLKGGESLDKKTGADFDLQSSSSSMVDSVTMVHFLYLLLHSKVNYMDYFYAMQKNKEIKKWDSKIL